jgi:hypothetical protein
MWPMAREAVKNRGFAAWCAERLPPFRTPGSTVKHSVAGQKKTLVGRTPLGPAILTRHKLAFRPRTSETRSVRDTGVPVIPGTPVQPRSSPPGDLPECQL